MCIISYTQAKCNEFSHVPCTLLIISIPESGIYPSDTDVIRFDKATIIWASVVFPDKTEGLVAGCGLGGAHDHI